MRQQGFSILELIVVLAIISVLIGLSAPRYLQWRANTVTTEAAQQFASDIIGQRTEAKRQNAVRRVIAAVGTNEYTLESLDENGAVSDSQTFVLPGNVRFAAVPTTKGVEFSPPYGTITEPLSTFEVEWRADTSIDRNVNVVGVMGRVVIQ